MDLSGHEGEIPIPISSSYVGGGHGHGHGHSIIHESTPSLHHPSSNGPPPPPPHPPPPPLSSTAAADDPHHHHHHHHHYNNSNAPKKGAGVKYRECLKNHAASIGGNATDGCGEFMPSGEEGTLEALKCSACSCHRNFHRKEAEGESAAAAAACDCYHPLNKGGRKMLMGQKGLLISGPDHPGHHHAFGSYGPAHAGNSFIPRPHHVGMIMPLGAMQSSESDDVEGGAVVGGGRALPHHHAAKKRFRTKFTPEQKEKMLSFAEKAGWRLQRQEESVVQQFCQEIGVRRRVLKVWMHNNKHSLAKKNPLPLE